MAEGPLKKQYNDTDVEGLNKKLQLLESDLKQYQENALQHPLMKRIEQWEQDAIVLILRTANEARITIINQLNKFLEKKSIDLTKLTEEIKQIDDENDLQEIQLTNLRGRLQKLHGQIKKPNHIQLKESSTLVKRLYVDVSPPKPSLHVTFDLPWSQNAKSIAGGHGKGSENDQISFPAGIDIDSDQTMYITDLANHRVMEWKQGENVGKIVAGGNGKGNQNDQLNWPSDVLVDQRNDSLIIADHKNRRVVRWPRRNGQHGETIISNVKCVGLAMNKNGDIYVVDDGKNEVRKWKIGAKDGTLVAGGNGRGTELNQLNKPSYIFVDDNESVYISDYENHRVVKWMKNAKEGIVVVGGQGQGNGVDQLDHPGGLYVDSLETIFVVDCDNHRVVRRVKGSKNSDIVVGFYDQGDQSNQLSNPLDLYVDREKNLFIVDLGNSRVQKFSIAGSE